jgi:hypothetical protein
VIYVCDVSALIAIADLTSRPAAVFAVLTDCVNTDVLCYCDEVMTELDDRDDEAAMWARAAASDRCNPGATFSTVDWVVKELPALVDTITTRESAAAPVIAQAVSLRDAGEDVTVVTEEIQERPARISVGAACGRLGIPAIGMRAFLEANGGEKYLGA